MFKYLYSKLVVIVTYDPNSIFLANSEGNVCLINASVYLLGVVLKNTVNVNISHYFNKKFVFSNINMLLPRFFKIGQFAFKRISFGTFRKKNKNI